MKATCSSVEECVWQTPFVAMNNTAHVLSYILAYSDSIRWSQGGLGVSYIAYSVQQVSAIQCVSSRSSIFFFSLITLFCVRQKHYNGRNLTQNSNNQFFIAIFIVLSYYSWIRKCNQDWWSYFVDLWIEFKQINYQ